MVKVSKLSHMWYWTVTCMTVCWSWPSFDFWLIFNSYSAECKVLARLFLQTLFVFICLKNKQSSVLVTSELRCSIFSRKLWLKCEKMWGCVFILSLLLLGSIAPSKFKLGINWTSSTAWTRSVSRSSYLRCTRNFWTGSAEPEFKPWPM